MMETILLYSVGDSSKLSTWSNVPALFLSALCKKQVRVILWISSLFLGSIDYSIALVLPFSKSSSNHKPVTYGRSFLHHFLTNRKSGKSPRNIPRLIFISFFPTGSGIYIRKNLLFYGAIGLILLSLSESGESLLGMKGFPATRMQSHSKCWQSLLHVSLLRQRHEAQVRSRRAMVRP